MIIMKDSFVETYKILLGHKLHVRCVAKGFYYIFEECLIAK